MADEPAPLASRGLHGKALPFAIVTLLMIGEGVGIFVLAKAMTPGPTSVFAGEGGEDRASDREAQLADEADPVEIELADCRPNNKMSGKLISFQIRISILVPASDQQRAEQLVDAKRARLLDRTNFVIRSAQLIHLNEPGLETIKRRLKHEYDRVFNDRELVREVLIPEWLQSNAGV